ncbi:MAG: acyl-CoA thioesterase [Chloroflexota bacterium]|nr:acyl-CoA thioesterase [Chloroflexota bacterium]
MPSRESAGRSAAISPAGSHDPARPSYVAHLRARFNEVDGLGHVNNAIYINYLEQTAIDHAAALGLDQERQATLGGVFIVRRHEIDYLQPAVAGDYLRVLTWIGDLRGARAVRFYEIRRLAAAATDGWPPPDRKLEVGEPVATSGDVILRARTDWAFVDNRSGRPRRMPAELLAVVDRD